MTIKKKTNISLLVFGVMILAFILFVIRPLFKGIKKDSYDFVSQKDKFISLKKENDSLMKFEEFKNDSSLGLKRINGLFIDPEVPISFIDFLNESAKSSHFLVDISPVNFVRNNKGLWPYIIFRLNFKSSFSDAMQFFDKLEKGPWLVDSLNLRMANNKKESVLDTSLTIKVYTKPLK